MRLCCSPIQISQRPKIASAIRNFQSAVFISHEPNPKDDLLPTRCHAPNSSKVLSWLIARLHTASTRYRCCDIWSSSLHHSEMKIPFSSSEEFTPKLILFLKPSCACRHHGTQRFPFYDFQPGSVDRTGISSLFLYSQEWYTRHLNVCFPGNIRHRRFWVIPWSVFAHS